MENDYLGEFEKMDAEIKEIEARMKKREEDGLANTLKHFDRIHDKLFDFNNLLIAGYFALAQINPQIPIFTIAIPLLNLAFLVFIEHKMMEKSRFESDIRNKSQVDIERWGNSIRKTNKYSFQMILSTGVVLLVVIFLLIINSKY